jgi:hypothetical protein
MYLLQGFIVGFVVVHNEYHHWTPNRVVAGIIGIAAAYVVTWVIWQLRRFWRGRE